MVPGGRAAGGGVGVMQQGRDKSLGYIAGMPDFVFLRGDWSAGLELKAPGGQPVMRKIRGKLVLRQSEPGKLRPSQKLYARWVADWDMEIATVTTLAGALEALRAWGVLSR